MFIVESTLIEDHAQNAATDLRTGVVMFDPTDEYQDELLERELREYIAEQIGNADPPLSTPVRWPTQDPEPINEYNTDGYMAMAFPSLFPTGRADFRDQSQQIEQVGLADYFESLLRHKDGRFGRHPRYVPFVLFS